MKKQFKYIFMIVAGLLGVSCNDFFDTIPGETLDLDKTFTSRDLTEKFLANVYSYVPDNNEQRYVNEDNTNSASWTAGSSEGEFCWGFSGSQDLNNGVDADNRLVKRYWKCYYRGINAASIFIENVDRCLEMDATDRLYRKAEARALRAYYYFSLFKIYGPVVVFGDHAVDYEKDDLLVPRNSVDECIKFITEELQKAADVLPTTLSSSAYGRINRPIALAMRSEALLYAASPLFNGNTDYAELKNKDGKALFPQTVSEQKWKDARDAAKAFLNEFVPSVYKLYMVDVHGSEYIGAPQKLDAYISYRETVRGNSFSNPEMIFYRISSNISGMNYEITPYHKDMPGEYKGAGSKGVTQEMVDMYFMSNGLRIDDGGSNYINSGKSASDYVDPVKADRIFAQSNTYNQWVGREPRFYADITFSNSIWLLTSPRVVTTTTYYNGNSGLGASSGDHTPTGYMVRKKAPTGNWNIGGQSCILIRLAEIYLNYAEACNECGDFDEAIKYVNLIRQRAGIPEYGTGIDDNGFTRIAVSKDKDLLRKRIQRERTIELSYEEHRFFDTRRWKVADMATGDGWLYPTYHKGGEGGEMHSLSIEKDEPEFYDIKVFETRAFTKKHYLFPIPQADINTNLNLVQNTGWEAKK